MTPNIPNEKKPLSAFFLPLPSCRLIFSSYTRGLSRDLTHTANFRFYGLGFTMCRVIQKRCRFILAGFIFQLKTCPYLNEAVWGLWHGCCLLVRTFHSLFQAVAAHEHWDFKCSEQGQALHFPPWCHCITEGMKKWKSCSCGSKNSSLLWQCSHPFITSYISHLLVTCGSKLRSKPNTELGRENNVLWVVAAFNLIKKKKS